MYAREKERLPHIKKEQGVYRSKTESVCKSCRAARETAKSRSRAAGIWKGVYLKTISDLSQGHSRFPPSLHDELGWPSQGNSPGKGGPGGQETRRKAAPAAISASSLIAAGKEGRDGKRPGKLQGSWDTAGKHCFAGCEALLCWKCKLLPPFHVPGILIFKHGHLGCHSPSWRNWRLRDLNFVNKEKLQVFVVTN